MPNPSAVPGRTAPIVYALCPFLLALCVTAQAAQPDRIVAPIDTNNTVALTGNVHPKAQPQYDQGPVDPAMKLPYITMSDQAYCETTSRFKALLERTAGSIIPKLPKGTHAGAIC